MDLRVPAATDGDRSYRAGVRTVLTVVLGGLAVVGWGVAGGLGAALTVVFDRPAFDADLAVGPDRTGEVPRDVALPDLPEPGASTVPGAPSATTYELIVHTDGCGVIRTEGPDAVDLGGLGWSVVDADGFEVLSRNALGETQYRYYAGGTYDLVLEAWGGDSYVPVSNTVTITC